jgi:hypothetical protein
MKLGVKNITGLGGVREARINDHQWDILLTVECDTGWIGGIPVRPTGYLFDDNGFGWYSDRETARLLRDRVITSMNSGNPVLVTTQQGTEKLDAKEFGFSAPTPKRFNIVHKRNGKSRG